MLHHYSNEVPASKATLCDLLKYCTWKLCATCISRYIESEEHGMFHEANEISENELPTKQHPKHVPYTTEHAHEIFNARINGQIPLLLTRGGT